MMDFSDIDILTSLIVFSASRGLLRSYGKLSQTIRYTSPAKILDF